MTAFRQRVKAADAVLFVTPEYNRSVRPFSRCTGCRFQAVGSSVWDRKPVRLSALAGRDRAFGANHHLSSRSCSERADHAAARSYVGHATSSSMNMASSQRRHRKFLQEFMQAFAIGSRRSDLRPVHLMACGNAGDRGIRQMEIAIADAQETSCCCAGAAKGIGHEVAELPTTSRARWRGRLHEGLAAAPP